MKKNTTYILLTLVIIVGGYFAYTLYQEDAQLGMSNAGISNFNIKDTSLINKMIITEKDKGTITLNRSNTNWWYINDSKVKAQPFNINTLLETAYQIHVKQDVGDSAVKTILTNLQVRHKKVEFFLKGEDHPTKVWFIGTGTQDHLGTYMLLENWDYAANKLVRSPLPYIMEKPGLRGTLDTRFFADELLWEYPGVFNYAINQIKTITVKFKADPKQNYEVTIFENGKVGLKDGDLTPVSVFDSNAVKHYVSHYKAIFYEKYVRDLNEQQIDSVVSSTPDYILTVTDINGKVQEALLWNILKPKEEVTDIELDLGTTFDTNRAYCSINGSKKLVTVQFYSWDVLFKPLKYLLPKTNVKFSEK